MNDQVSLQELVRAGDALVVQLDFPPDTAKGAQREAAKALKEWRRVSDAAKRQLGLGA